MVVERMARYSIVGYEVALAKMLDEWNIGISAGAVPSLVRLNSSSPGNSSARNTHTKSKILASTCFCTLIFPKPQDTINLMLHISD